MTATPSLIDDCFLHDKDRLRHDEALDLLKERLAPVVSAQTVSLNDSLGRILAQKIAAPHPVPLHTNAAVDGYAFRHSDLTTSALPVVGRIAAGDLEPAALPKGAAVRIFTGAIMPDGADTVAMQEDCQLENNKVSIPTGLKAGANCRQAGEDLADGDKVLDAGTRLQAADIAALASIGLSEIPVFQRLKVAVLSNGNEMRRVGDTPRPLKRGEVYDANMPLICALAASLPLEIRDCGLIRDDAAAAEAAISSAAQDNDVIITTGGASRGSEDHMLTTLDRLGKRHLWQLAVKPGRPMMFGQISRSENTADCLFFGLPGNPVAAMLCFLLYTRPALLKLAGARWQTPPRFPLPANFEITNKKPDRREFLRGILNDQGETLCVDKFARDGSGLISSLREADGLIEIAENVTQVRRGDNVSFIPFSSLR